MKKAILIKILAGNYQLLDIMTNEIIDASIRGKLKYQKIDEKSSFNVNIGLKTKKEQKIIQISPKVGDYVNYSDFEGHYYIDEILERRNSLTRPDVSNVDLVLLLFSATEPVFSFNLLDQFLIIMEQNNLNPTIVVSKIDLVKEEELKELKIKLDYYQSIGYSVYYINSIDKIGFESLKHIFKNKITVLAGQTGVGKSTLLNALKPELELKTQEISRALGRGKHTTRHSELYPYNGGWIADTPGFSKIEIDIDYEDELKNYYKDYVILAAKCRFKNSCNHVNEPDCNVKNTLDSDIKKIRYNNYINFFNSIKNKKRIY